MEKEEKVDKVIDNSILDVKEITGNNESALPEMAAIDYVGHPEYMDSLLSVDACKKKHSLFLNVQCFSVKALEEIGEFTAAISERDEYIGKLETKLQECINQRDNLAKDAETQSKEFMKEIDLLRQQLEETINLVERQKRTGVSLVEHIELKNKLIRLQQDRGEEKEAVKSVKEQLKSKNDALRDLEPKYMLLLKMHKKAKEKQYLEAAEKESLVTCHQEEMERMREEHRRQMEMMGAERRTREEEQRAWLEERERHRKELNQWREEVEEVKRENSLLLEHREEKAKAEEEIHTLKLELREATEEISRILAADQSLLKESEEKMENLRKELSEKHEVDLEDLKTKYKAEVALVAQQIDLLERSQEEEQMEIMKNLEEIRNEAISYRTLLEEERGKCERCAAELEKSKHRCLSLESELSLLSHELMMSKSVAKDIDQVTKEKQLLQDKISDLEFEVERLLAGEKVRSEELAKVKKDYEREKEMKNETNLKLQELNMKSELLVLKLREKEADLEAALYLKEKLENEVQDFRLRLKAFEEESRTVSKLKNEILSKTELEKQVSILTQEVHALTSSLANLEQYKLECHSIKERIMKLVRVLREREVCPNIEVSARDLNNADGADAEVSDHFSLLEAHISFISTRLEESQSLKTELHTVLKQNSLYKEELDKLTLQQSKGDDLLTMSTEMVPDWQLSLSAVPMENCQSGRTFANVTDKQDGDVKTSIGCQTCSVPTQEQGFQTSGMANSPEGVFASKTIQEDYILEEIFVVPTRRVALKGSVSLKNLKEIGVTSADDISGTTGLSVLLSGSDSSAQLTAADYEHLKAKFHESQFMVKSLENENFYLKRALQFKNNVIGTGTCATEKSAGGRNENRAQEVVVDQRDLCTDVKTLKEASSQTESDIPVATCSEGATELRKNLLDAMAEKLDLLEKGEGHLRKIESLQKEIFRLHKWRLELDEGKETADEKDSSHSRKFSDKSTPPAKKLLQKLSVSAASLGDRPPKRPANLVAAKSRHHETKCKTTRGLSSPLDALGEGGGNNPKVPNGVPKARKMSRGVIGAEVEEEEKQLTEKKGEVEEEEEEEKMWEGEGAKPNSELDLFRRNIWETKLSIQMQITETLKEELKDKCLAASEDGASEEWMHYLRAALTMFFACRYPCFGRKAEWVSNIAEGWNRALRSEVREQYTEERKEQKEQFGGGGEREGEKECQALLQSVLEDLRSFVMEQKGLQKAIKEFENNLISHLDSNISHCKEQTRPANLNMVPEVYGLGGFSSIHSVGFCGSDLVGVSEAETDFLREFEDITSAIVNRAQEEKIELLQNQRIMMLKIFEENQSRISEICRSHLKKLRDTSVEDCSSADAEGELAMVAEEIESSLSEEAHWMEREYGELLKQYSHEQSLHSHSHSLTLREFRQRVNTLLQHAKCQPSLNNMELWKPLLSLLSQVTLNLLHYYTVSQRFANHEGDSEFMPDAFPGASHLGATPYSSTVSPPDEGSEGENSLRISLPDEGVLNTLDTTGTSEGMLEDLERNEQVKGMLTTSYPHLIKALKGSYDQVSLPALEGEVQELIISLQAAAGMLRVFMLAKGELGSLSASASSSRTVTAESGVVTSFDLKHEEKYHSLLQEPLCRYEEPDESPPGIISNCENHIDVSPQPHSNSDADSLTTKEQNPSSLSLSSSSDYTLLKPPRSEENSQQVLEDLRAKLSEAKKEREHLLTQLHHTQGLYAGQVDEKEALSSDFAKREETIEHLVKELQDTKALLVDADRRLKETELPSKKKTRKQMDKDIKDKVKAVLAAKDRQSLGHEELAERVRDLENVLEEVVRERDKSLEHLNLKVADLTQQLEVADRQLRSSRQFLEEQATERDLEIEELVRANEKLNEQLKEKDALVMQHFGLQKEMRLLEKELREKYASLGEERAKREGKQNELAAALDKVKDLREVLHSVEAQLTTKCSEVRDLQEQSSSLSQDLDEARKQNLQLHTQLENALKQSTSTPIPVPPKSPTLTPYDYGEPRKDSLMCKQPLERQISLSEELENTETNQSRDENHRDPQGLAPLSQAPAPLSQAPQTLDLSHDVSLLENLIIRLERSTQGLETLQLTLASGGSLSDEELSVRDRLEMSAGRASLPEKMRALSPASLEAKLEEKLLAFERSAEAAAKYTKDLEMRLSNLKAEFDEIVCERDELHQQLSALSSLKSELEKASEEFDLLRRDFERNVLSLKGELEQSKRTAQCLRKQLKDAETKLETRGKETKKALAEGLENLEAEKLLLENEMKSLESAVGELTQEREMLRRQNSEHLIKISGLEARLEEFRRGADSPYELEFRVRISTLQEELERSRAELTSRFRESEELRYTVKELHEKLVLREEELDRLNQAPDEPVSLPQSFKDQNRHRVQTLEEEVQRQRSVNKELKEKLQVSERSLGGDSAILSNTLFECLLDEKNIRIEELLHQKEDLIEAVQAGLAQLDDKQPLEEVAKALRKCLLLKDWTLKVHGRSGPCPEVQRRAPPDQSVEVVQDSQSDVPKPSAAEETNVSSVMSSGTGNRQHLSLNSLRSSLSLESLGPPVTGDHKASSRREQTCRPISTQTDEAVNLRDSLSEADESTRTFIDRSEFDTLTTENVLLKDQILILEQEVKGLTDYQRKLEDDFNAAQEMLDAKEEEIQALTEEVEDGLPAPLPTSSCQITEDRSNELMFENEALEERCRELEVRLQTQEAAADEAQNAAKELDQFRQRFEEEFKKNEELARKKDALEQKTFSVKRQLEEEGGRCERLRQDLSARNQEVEDLSAQLDRLLTQFKDSNTRHEKRIKALERDHFREMQDMKDKNIDREKQLCCEYEERMSAQVSDLALRFSREKEESLKSFKEHYEALLSKALQDKPKQKREEGVASSTRYGHRSSSEDLQKDLQRELEASASLDQSIFCYLEGSTGSGGSRESSVLSEGGSAPPAKDGHSNALRIQSLMRKVHKEGIQVLTLSEFLFLQNHQSSVAAVGRPDPSSGNKQKPEEGFPEIVGLRGDPNSSKFGVDGELPQMRKKLELLKFSLSQEKGLNQELQDALQREKQEVDDLRKHLEAERARQFETTSEMVRVKCQGQLTDKELRLSHEGIRELRERLETSDKQVHDLGEALSAERYNFNHVSTTLNHQRKLAATSTDHQSQLIKELRNCLEKERTRVLALVSEVHDLKTSRSQPLSLEESMKSGLDCHSSFFVEKEIHLAMAVDKERELQRELGELRVSLQALTEERTYERERYLKELREERLQADQLRNALIKLESKKNAVAAELEEKSRLIRDLEMNVKRQQEEICDLQDDLRKKSSSPDGDLTLPKTRGYLRMGATESAGVSNLCKDELHALTLSKLKQKDAEVASLKRKLSQLETELRLFEEKERVLLMETQRGVGPHSPHGPHVAPRIKNLTEFLEIQQRENIELCKSLARLTDDRRLLRQRIMMLEGVVDELNLQLANQEKFLMHENLSEKNIYCAEKATLAAETSTLKLALSQSEAKKQELEMLILELQKSAESQTEVALKRENLSTRYMCWKYSRSESYRKALVWQKEYLLQLLKGYQVTEKRAIGRLTTLARNVVGVEGEGDNIPPEQNGISRLPPIAKFKSLVFVVIAVQRMKILLRRWQLKSKLRSFVKPTLPSADLPSFSPSPVTPLQHPPSSDSRGGPASLFVTQGPSTSHPPFSALSTADVRPRPFQISGFTPPTKEPAEFKRTLPPVAHSTQSRNLFGSRKDESDLNECIYRLDYIHSQLGLPKTPS